MATSKQAQAERPHLPDGPNTPAVDLIAVKEAQEAAATAAAQLNGVLRADRLRTALAKAREGFLAIEQLPDVDAVHRGPIARGAMAEIDAALAADLTL